MAKIFAPEPGKLYHGVFPGGKEGDEAGVSAENLVAYERAAGRKAAWVYFSHEWGLKERGGPNFPASTVDWIHWYGATPFIRLMLRTSLQQFVREPLYTLQSIVEGKFDRQLEAWGTAAGLKGIPLICEFGTEVNGAWFPWNAVHNGGPKGPELFRKAYRHIVDAIRAAGGQQITWVYHVNHGSDPDTFVAGHQSCDWNAIEAYDPGIEYADWIGLSIYGSQRPGDNDGPAFSVRMEELKDRLSKLAQGRPIMICEFAYANQADAKFVKDWVQDTLEYLLPSEPEKVPFISGFSWWNEAWNDSGTEIEMRLQALPDEVQQIFRERLRSNRVVDSPIQIK